MHFDQYYLTYFEGFLFFLLNKVNPDLILILSISYLNNLSLYKISKASRGEILSTLILSNSLKKI